MLMGLVYTFCRLLAAFVCFLSVNEAPGVSLSALTFSSERQWRAASSDEPADPSIQDTREERDAREGEGEGDHHDDDIDGSRHAASAALAEVEPGATQAGFPRARIESAPGKSHQTLDLRPPRHR